MNKSIVLSVGFVALLLAAAFGSIQRGVGAQGDREVLVMDTLKAVVLIDSLRVIAYVDSSGIPRPPDSSLMPPVPLSGVTEFEVVVPRGESTYALRR